MKSCALSLDLFFLARNVCFWCLPGFAAVFVQESGLAWDNDFFFFVVGVGVGLGVCRAALGGV